jgi:phosphoglycolate phosphatase-like HAD superfamily hydrolase
MDAQDHVRRLRDEGLIVDVIKAVLFEPVGCLAEFQPDEFNSAAADLFGASPDPTATGSQAYWRLLGLMEQHQDAISIEGSVRLLELELRAVVQTELYEDVRPSLEELKTLGVAAHLASSLSRTAVAHFLERHSLADLFVGRITRTEASGVMAKPLRLAIDQAGLDPAHVMALADTARALEMTKRLGLNAMLMINDYDEGRALAERNPAGGIISLAELPDALRLIEQRSGISAPSRPPLAPFELFDPT